MPEPTFYVIDLMPDDTPEFMAPAWLSALSFTIKQDGAMRAFREATGCTYTAPMTPLEQMIDQATGADVAFLTAFIQWFNEAVWGPMGEAPNG